MIETQEIIRQVSVLSYGGIWLMSFAANVIVPIPEEGVLLILGYVAGGPTWNGLLLLLVIYSGVIASDILIYSLARGGNKLVTGAYNKIFASKIEGRKDWIIKNMDKVIFFSRFLIQLRFLGPFLAGQMKVSFRKFITLDALALLIYIPFYVTIGWYFRSRIDAILNGIGVVRNMIVAVVIIFVLFSLVRYMRRKFFDIKQ